MDRQAVFTSRRPQVAGCDRRPIAGRVPAPISGSRQCGPSAGLVARSRDREGVHAVKLGDTPAALEFDLHASLRCAGDREPFRAP